MKITGILFTSLAYSLLAALIVSASVEDTTLDFPVLEIPVVDPIDLSGGCGSFFDCTEYLANVLYNIGVYVIATIELFINLALFAFDLIGLLLSFSTGIDGAPWYVNALISGPAAAAIAVIIYRLIRSGASED